MSEDTLDRLIARINNGDVEAMERVFHAYEPQLRMAVRRRLGPRLRSKVDSTDILQSTFADVLGGLRKGNWRFANRLQMLAFLKKIAMRRLADRYRQNRLGLERERSLDDLAAQAMPRSVQPRPSEVAQGREFWEKVSRACPPQHREVVRLRMEGLKMAEIAARTGLHEGSVRRVLYELARRLSIAGRDGSPGPYEER